MSLHAASSETKVGSTPPAQDHAELRKALDDALQRLDRDAEDAGAWREVGRTRAALRIDDEAIVAALERAADLDKAGMRPELWLALGRAAMRSAHHDVALRAVEELTLAKPGEPSLWIFKSMALENLGRTEEAEAALRRAASIDPEPKTCVAIAFALGLLGRYDEALALDEQAIRDSEGNPWAWTNKGLHLAKKAEKMDDGPERREAIAGVHRAFERAIAAAPSDPAVLRNYGVALGGLELYEDACERLEEALEKNQDDVATLRSLGFVLTKLHRDKSALEKDSRAAELAPRHPVVWRSKGIDLFHIGRFEEALYAFEQATDLAPEGADMWHAKGTALWKLAQYEEAVDAFSRATGLNSDSPDAWLGFAASLNALGRHGDAIEALRRAVGLCPKRLDIWTMLGSTYRESGNPVAAEHAFRRGFELQGSVVMASAVADALAAQGKEDEALEFVEKRIPSGRDEAELAYLRGVLLTRLGREDEATAELSAAVQRWRSEGVRDGRATTVENALARYYGPRGAAASWSEHWFGRQSDATTRTLGVILLVGLIAALAIPLIVPGELAPLKYGAGWAAITLPVTVLVLLLALPTVQSIKAGGGSFEVTTIVLPALDQRALALPSQVRIEKVADLPSLDPRAVNLGDLLPSVLDRGSPDIKAAQQRRTGTAR
jgi:tetratricopeptide (TPR) repeat protein